MDSSSPSKRSVAKISFQDELPGITPLEIEDERYTKNPTDDREKLTLAIEALAKRSVSILSKDHETKKRYATKLILSNRIKTLKGAQPSGQLKERNERESFPVSLPNTVDTWNEMDEEDIQIQMIKSVVDINELYKWHRLKMQFIYFINETTYRLLKAEHEKGRLSSLATVFKANPQAASSTTTTTFTRKNPPKSTTGQTKSQQTSHSSKFARIGSAKKMPVPTAQSSDDEIEIVYETSK